MNSVSRVPVAKHGLVLKNPGFTGKNRPVIKIKAVLTAKKTSKGGARTKSRSRRKSKSMSKKGGRSSRAKKGMGGARHKTRKQRK